MTMYINKNFRMRSAWIRKEVEPQKCVPSKFISLCRVYGDVACIALSLSNINIQSHMHFPLFMKINFIIFTNLPCFLASFFSFNYQSTEKPRFFSALFERICLYYYRARFFFLLFFRIPPVFLSLIASGWPASLHPLFLFWRGLNAAHWWKSHFRHSEQ